MTFTDPSAFTTEQVEEILHRWAPGGALLAAPEGVRNP